MKVKQATLRNGDVIDLNEEVTCHFNSKMEGHRFIIFEMTYVENAESKVACKAHLKGFPERVIKTITPEGLDANWFKKIK